MKYPALRWIALLLWPLPAAYPARQIAIAEYAIPAPGGLATAIARGSDGNLWFPDVWGNRIGRATPAGEIIEYPLPTPGAAPVGIAAGPDGALWFTEQFGDKIGRITTTGTITEFPLPIAGSFAQQIATGPDGALWFTAPGTSANGGGRIGRISTQGVVKEYLVNNGDSGPQGITTGPDGALWFTDITGSRIGRITTAGSITEYPLPNAFSGPDGIAPGSDGELWFAEQYGNRIGKITTAGVVTEYPLPTPDASPVAIAPGRAGFMWFTEAGKIGRIASDGVITEYPTPHADSALALTTIPGDQIWLAGFYIDQVVFVTANLTVTPPSAAYKQTLTFTAGGFAPGESVPIYTRSVGSPILVTGAADSSGSFTVTANNPSWFQGPRIFLGAGQTSGILGAASLLVTPAVNLAPNTGLAGSTLEVNGSGFGVFEEVLIFWNNSVGNSLVGTTTANANGAFQGFEFTVPSDAPPGAHFVTAFGRTTRTQGQGLFTVE